jgi:cytochrome bd ubiquinol oxidase subunit II
MELITYNVIWFILVGVLLTVYAILEGFDLGCGILHLFAKSEDERNTITKSIGPVWDENEVWLITGGGALFAAFPHVYSSVFSGFYLAIIVLMLAILFRATGIEIRNKFEKQSWRKVWDLAFGISSLLIALLLGTALGNVLHGVPMGVDKEINISLLGLLNPFSLLFGIGTVAVFALHGNIYAITKSEGEVEKSFIQKLKYTYPIAVLCIIAVLITGMFQSHLTANYAANPLLIIIPILVLVVYTFLIIHILKKKYKPAFVFSSLGITFLMTMIVVAMFPNIVFSSLLPEFNLNIYNSASSQLTLKTMLIIAGIGLPPVIIYTLYIYRVFRGKINLSEKTDY